MKYSPSIIEKKWQKVWEAKKLGAAGDFLTKSKYYCLFEFPYPSGAGLHVGHARPYVGTDVLARFKRMRGYNVLYPIGWDAFGLPTENFAIKNKIHPRVATDANIKKFKKQMRALGLSVDWDREIDTTAPQYYKWTQWIFLQLYKAGMAYRAEIPIHWCPSCKTGLANEEVIDGKHERCGTPVTEKLKKQWLIRITKYADRLIRDLQGVDFPERVKTQQINWIGRSEGAEIDFEIRTREKPDFVLLHGYKGSPETNFFPWLAAELKKRGYEVQMPYLPHSEESGANEKDDTEALWKSVKFSRNTVLVGHSLGALVAMRALEELKEPIRKFVLVGGFLEPKFRDHDRPWTEKFNWNFDFAVIRKNAGRVVILHDANDAVVPYDQGRKLADALGGELFEPTPADTHFCGVREPAVLRHALDTVRVFTTRPDTLFGATYMVVAPEHPLAAGGKWQMANREEVSEYVARARAKTSEERIVEGKEKTGVVLQGITAINPANGEEIPVWVADYVLGNVGTGAIMAVPAHDNRDFAFAKKYNLPIKMVVCPHYPAPTCPVLDVAYTGAGHLVDSGTFSGMESEKAKDAIAEFIGGEKKIQYRLRDWVFSRQRYWGEPIPIVYCEQCGAQDTETKLTIDFHGEHRWDAIVSGKKTIETRALYLPERKKLKAGDLIRLENKTTGVVKIAKIIETYIFQTFSELLQRQDLLREIFPDEEIGDLESLKKRYGLVDAGYVAKIEKYGLAAWKIELINPEKTVSIPEADLPVFLPDVKNYEPTETGESPLAALKSFVETKCPVCGGPAHRETDTMPNWAGSNWYFLRYLDPKNDKAFADRKKIDYWMPVDLYNGGMEHTTLHLLYSRFIYKFLYDQGHVPQSEPYTKRTSHGIILAEDGRKMSKSFGNVVSPDDVVQEYGADTLRLYEMFIAPFDQMVAWNTHGVIGVRRFLDRVWKLYEGKFSENATEDAERIVQKLVKKVGEDIVAMKFNTAISAFMESLNALEKCAAVSRTAAQMYLLALAPFAPHIAEELWERHSAFGVRGFAFGSIHEWEWPKYDERLVQENTFELVVQINGKMRATISLPLGALQEEAEQVARAHEAVAKHLQDKTPKRVVFVPGRLINFVA